MGEIFVLLGKKGKVSKKIKFYLNSLNLPFLSISWNEFSKYGLHRFLLNKEFDQLLLKRNINNKKIFFIDCFIGDFINNDESILHIDLLKTSKQLFPYSKFIYLSTYEPQLAQVTHYRKMKYRMENVLSCKGAYIVRIGQPTIQDYFVENNKKLIFNFRSFSNKRVLVPFTNISELIKVILNLSKNKINKCYSGYLQLALSIENIPKIVFVNNNSSFKIFLPLEFIYIFSTFFVMLLRKLGFKKIIFFIEKPISLIAQQKIIFNEIKLFNFDKNGK